MKVERNNVPVSNSGFTVTAITQYQITFVLFWFVSALEHFVSAIISNLSRSWNNGWDLTPKCYHVKPCLLKAKLKSKLKVALTQISLGFSGFLVSHMLLQLKVMANTLCQDLPK